MSDRLQWVTDPACLLRDPCSCTIDPISLGAVALGALAGGGAMAASGGGKSSGPAPDPATPPAPPPEAAPQQAPTPKRQASMSGPSSFLGGVPTPPPSTGSKTLLGQ